jgi:C4-dicarboxylate transporter DctQ subunit
MLAVLAALTYALLLLVGASEHIADLRRLGTEDQSLDIPQWQLLAILPVGFGLLLLRLAQAAFRIWTRRQEGLLNTDETAEALAHHLVSLTTEATGDPASRRAAKPR